MAKIVLEEMRLSLAERLVHYIRLVHLYGHHLLCAKMVDAWANELTISPCARDENALYSHANHYARPWSEFSSLTSIV